MAVDPFLVLHGELNGATATVVVLEVLFDTRVQQRAQLGGSESMRGIEFKFALSWNTQQKAFRRRNRKSFFSIEGRMMTAGFSRSLICLLISARHTEIFLKII